MGGASEVLSFRFAVRDLGDVEPPIWEQDALCFSLTVLCGGKVEDEARTAPEAGSISCHRFMARFPPIYIPCLAVDDGRQVIEKD
jgi:hypothetical protein